MNRSAPLPSPTRIAPLPWGYRIAPLPAASDVLVVAGSAKRLLLGETGFPFSDCYLDPNTLEPSSAAWKVETDVGYTAIPLGSYPDLVGAVQMVTWSPSAFSTGLGCLLKLTIGGLDYISELDIVSDVRIGATKAARINRRIRPFCDATFAATAASVASAAYEVTGEVIKTAIVPAGGESIMDAVRKLELEWATVGNRHLILYVTDTSAQEYSAVTQVYVTA